MAQLGDSQIQRACPGVELPVPIPFAGVRPFSTSFAVSGAAQGVGFGSHQGVNGGGQQLAQHVGKLPIC